MKTRIVRLLAAFSAISLCHCGAPQPPQCRRVPFASRAPAPTLVSTARDSWKVLDNPARQNEWPTARATYNGAVAKLFDQLRCHGGDWNGRASALGTKIAPADRTTADPATFDALFPAATVDPGKLHQRHVTEGVGVTLVGWRKTTPLNVPRPPFFLPTGMPMSVNATLRFDAGGEPSWHFVKRWIADDITLAGGDRKLAADWTAPNAFYWKMSDLDNLTIQNVLLPGRYMDETGLYFLEPYNPKKIPVVMVHGLKSSPDAFKFLINDLSPEPWFRERYQVWLFNYPTGNPWIYSGVRFREYMEAATRYARTKGDDTNLNKMVILCHSMGGLITRSSVTDPGTKFYDEHFDKPIDQLEVTPHTREMIRKAMLYKPLPEPKRVVFMAVPHHGSPMANLRWAMMTSNLIRLPKALTVDLADATLHSVTDAVQTSKPPAMPTSISSLSPKSRSIRGLAKMPLPKGITFHSIHGNRGTGAIPDCSDGVVPYWSSHVTPVASEEMVPWPHGVVDCPVASREVKRILKLHLGQ